MGTAIDSIIGGVSMKVADPFDMGAGHINPSRALDLGLIYDIKPKLTTYTIFLCKLGFTKQHTNKIINPLSRSKLQSPTTTSNYNNQ
jgi:hypothetical protein